jgi:hypothetical protein
MMMTAWNPTVTLVVKHSTIVQHANTERLASERILITLKVHAGSSSE